MSSSVPHVGIDDCDDFTFTEDPAGHKVRVPVSKEYVFKVVVLGDYSVGKTSLIKRLLSVSASSLSLGHNGDDSDMGDSDDDSDAEAVLAAVTPTMGTDFYSLTVPNAVPGASVRLQIWDTAGLEKYAPNYKSTLRNASFVICVFDVTSASSLHSVVDRHLSIAAEHLPELDQSSIMVVANKADIVADVANNTRELRHARQRALLPEGAFLVANDAATATDTNDGSAGICTSADGVGEDSIVTARKVQAEVLDLFTDVHYAEVSAKTKQHLREMLQAVCYALLRNSADGHLNEQIPARTPPSEVLARTVLPRDSVASPLTAVGIPALSSSSEPPVDPDTSKILPAVVPRDLAGADGVQPSVRETPAPPAGSWRSTGAFTFDVAPTHSGLTAVFSPIEGFDRDIVKPEGDESPPSHAVVSDDSPVNRPSTEMPTPRESFLKPADAGGAHLDGSAGARKPRRAPDLNENPKARKERERAEMKELLEGAGQRRASSSGGLAAPDCLDVRLRSDADKMEMDMARGLDNVSDASSALWPGAMTTNLDSLGVQSGRQVERGAEGRESDDDDGARMQAQLRERFAQIERDVHKNAAAAKQRAKKAKAKGKCQCCVL
ncbi:hypothetical protein JIQ42_02660 [Leishmania sp. Namibia]|uniref:hypothetical protein n=1 Tax=Leishmania sp. Namibia TaxID=2802991 RepID=UPI001B5EF753|nr:hypothetical protein JIQ42_02660 [Leishmania sp. Namibia]